MEKPKKTYFDHAMERAIKKARFLMEDLTPLRDPAIRLVRNPSHRQADCRWIGSANH